MTSFQTQSHNAKTQRQRIRPQFLLCVLSPSRQSLWKKTHCNSKMADSEHPRVINVDVQDGGGKPSKVKMIVLIVAGFFLILAAAILFWKFWYCPGPLGFFSWFRCKCAGNATRGKDRRCTCVQWFNEMGSTCTTCGDLQQPCCKTNEMCRDYMFPPPEEHYQCDVTTNLCGRFFPDGVA